MKFCYDSGIFKSITMFRADIGLSVIAIILSFSLTQVALQNDANMRSYSENLLIKLSLHRHSDTQVHQRDKKHSIRGT